MSYFSLCPLTGSRGPDARLGMELTHENQVRGNSPDGPQAQRLDCDLHPGKGREAQRSD